MQPAYTIKIVSAATLPNAVREHVEIAKGAIAQGRSDYQKTRGGDIDVYIEFGPFH